MGLIISYRSPDHEFPIPVSSTTTRWNQDPRLPSQPLNSHSTTIPKSAIPCPQDTFISRRRNDAIDERICNRSNSSMQLAVFTILNPGRYLPYLSHQCPGRKGLSIYVRTCDDISSRPVPSSPSSSSSVTPQARYISARQPRARWNEWQTHHLERKASFSSRAIIDDDDDDGMSNELVLRIYMDGGTYKDGPWSVFAAGSCYVRRRNFAPWGRNGRTDGLYYSYRLPVRRRGSGRTGFDCLFYLGNIQHNLLSLDPQSMAQHHLMARGPVILSSSPPPIFGPPNQP